MSTLTLHAPFIISSRLLPALVIAGATLSLGAGPRNAEGRTVYECWLDLPDGSEHELTDLRSGCERMGSDRASLVVSCSAYNGLVYLADGQGGDYLEGFKALLSFLGAAANSYRYRKCNWEEIDSDDSASSFPRPVVEWAYQNSDELQMLEIEIEEGAQA